MKAMLLKKINTPLVLEDVPMPKIGEDEVLLRVKACGLCATDLKVLNGELGTSGLPRIIGHEPMGEIVEIGKNVKGFRIGERAAVSIYITCGVCKYCRSARSTLCLNIKARIGFDWDGGFAEYMKVPVLNLVKVPEGVSDEGAAILSCGITVPYHALKVRANLGPEDIIIIIGVGGLGIHAVQVGKLLGSTVIAVDIDDDKLDLAIKYGADYTIKYSPDTYSKKVLEIGNPTAVLDTVGNSQMLKENLELLQPGGKMVLVSYGSGKEFSGLLKTIAMSEIEIIGARGATTLELTQVSKLVGLGRIKPVISDIFKLSELNEAIERLRSGKILARAVIKP